MVYRPALLSGYIESNFLHNVWRWKVSKCGMAQNRDT